MGRGKTARRLGELEFESEFDGRRNARLRARAESLATLVGKAQWFAAMRWRRRVERALRTAELTFTQWLVLDATRQLIFETGDAVSQNDVSAKTDLDRATISQVMTTLERKALVDRGISASGRAWRIWLTARGTRLLDAQRASVEAASRG
jgi:DNA-binding MarR family transcriptional regulator